MNSFFSLHVAKWLYLAAGLTAVLALNLYAGGLKPLDAIAWLDIFGEGATVALSLLLLAFTLSTRPRGTVTSLIAFGLGCFCAAAFQDWLDEIVVLAREQIFDDVVESVIAPIGIVSLALGLRHWHRENQIINRRLQRKERFYRQHSALDFVTDLYTALYMEQQIKRELLLCRRAGLRCAVVMADIDNFDDFNRCYGEREGDRLLRQAADLIVMNLRQNDLACRYAGDRFIVLLPETGRAEAGRIVDELQRALHSLAFKPGGRARSVYHRFSFGLAVSASGDDSEQLINQANRDLEGHKSLQRRGLAQAS